MSSDVEWAQFGRRQFHVRQRGPLIATDAKIEQEHVTSWLASSSSSSRALLDAGKTQQNTIMK